MNPGIIYLACGLMSGVCAVLLLRSYARYRLRLLLWTGVGFAAFTANNILLFLDMIVFLKIDLSPYRTATALAGVALLLYGLIWDA